MQTYISLLRGINVSGQKIIKMLDLKSLYQELSLQNVRTYIQSGNVVFQHTIESKKIAKDLEQKIKEKYSFEVSVHVITKDNLIEIINKNPFQDMDVNKLYFVFLFEALGQGKLSEIDHDFISKKKQINEKFVISKNVVYFYSPDSYGKTKLTNQFFEKQFNVIATTRNYKTVKRLIEISNII